MHNYVCTTLSVAPHIDAIKTAVASHGDQLTPREHGYIRAVMAYASGNLLKATEELCSMLIQYPLGELFLPYTSKNVINFDNVDAVALRITFISFSFLGEFERMRDMFARSMVHWSEDMLLYPFVLGL